MVQPKDAPISFRPGDERLARIEAWAKERKLSRHLAILTLIDAGLRGEAVAADPVKAAPAPKPKPVPKVEKVSPVHVEVPLFKRPEFRPMPKKGMK